MSKSIKILVLVLFIYAINGAVAKFRKIPAPSINTEPSLCSPGSSIEIKGSGFIKDFAKAHKILIKKAKKKIRLKVSQSTEDSLKLSIPEALELGDYDLHIFLKTRFFKSKKQKLKNFIQVRPKAPERPQLEFLVIKEADEILDLSNDKDLKLELEGDLKTGKNKAKAFYFQEGYKSLSSEAVEFYYIPELDFESKLEINSEQPLSSFAKPNQFGEKIEVSSITQFTEQDLKRSYFLMTPRDKKYLITEILLSPIYIKEAHVKSPEYLIIKNRSSSGFDLSSCYIDDAIKTRYLFNELGPNSIAAKSEIKVEANFGFNDSGDEIKLFCEDKSVEELSYDSISADGFAIF